MFAKDFTSLCKTTTVNVSEAVSNTIDQMGLKVGKLSGGTKESRAEE